MNFRAPFLVIFSLLVSSSSFAQRSYKELMNDNSVNFYEVCEVADAYFASIDKDAKGSGWKPYQRWKAENESKFYPDGDRSIVDPYLAQKAYERMLTEEGMEKVLYDGGWEELGPGTVDSITGHYAAGLGRLETFYVNPDDADVMYIGSRSGGFWKTTDGGDSWTGGTTDFLFACGVNTIGVSPTNQDSILINVRNSGNGTTHGIYRSTDGGETWAETDYNPVELGKGGLGSNFKINRVVYHPRVADLIFVCASDGLYRSDDNLDTWLKVTTGSISDIEFHPTDNDIVYIYDYYYWGANKNKVLYSLDQGLTFTGSAEIVGNSNNTSVQLDVTPLCEDCIYFASGNGIWKSFDKGLTFEFVSNPDSGSQGFAVGDLDSSKMIYGYVDCFTSEDGGINFDQTTWWSLGNAAHGAGSFQVRHNNSEHYIHADLREAECINGVFYVATDGYFGKSEDNGLTWEHLNHNTSTRENYTLGASQSNHYRTIVGSQDNGTSIKHQTTWLEYTGGDGMEGIIHPLNDDWMISSYQYGSRTKTFDGGLTRSGASPPGHSSFWVAPMAYDPNDHLTIYHFGVNVHRTDDFTASWEVVGTPSFSGQIKEAAVAENNTDIVIASRNQYIERSIDGGATWVDIKGTLPNYTITDIAFDPKQDSTFVVTYNRWQDDGEKVFITHDLGNTWTNITENLNDMPIRGAVIDHSDESYIYLAAEIGVYVKAMDATDWELYNEDLPNCMVNELEVVKGSNTLRAATWGRGVWEYTLKDRNTYPAILITKITDQPTYDTPKEGVDQYVTSKIHYDGAISSAYVKWSADEPLFDNTIPMENVSDTTWVTETPIPDYMEGTKIYFKVFAVGESGDTTETYKFMYVVRPFEYCEAIGDAGTGSDYIDFVELGGEISNSSGQEYYGDFTDIVANLYIDSTYTLQVGMNYHWDPDTTGAWIDFNQNAVFDDEEFIVLSELDVAHQSFGDFTVPPHAVIGDTVRMRVRSMYWDLGPVPCGVETGEVEDYSIVFSCADSYAEIDASTCDIYTSPSGAYEWSEAGIYTDTLSNTYGCDSIITVNLSIDIIESEMDAAACYSYESPSGLYTWTETGVYTDTLLSMEGCDSIVTVNLAIEHTTSEIEVTGCNTYTSPSGLYTWTESGTYSDTLTNEAGCDSIIAIDLTIEMVNTDVTAGDYELTADAEGLTYQWLDCNDDWAEIDGATAQTFEPLENGSYAVIVTDGDCADTSDCFDIVALSIISSEMEQTVQLFPNPTNGSFSLIFNEVKPEVTVKVYDASGRIVFNQKFEDQKDIAIDLKVASGIYYVGLEGVESEKMIIRLVIE